MLIPFSIWQINEILKKRVGKSISRIFIFLVIAYICSIIKPALLGEIGGALRPTQIPSEYIKLEKFLSQQDTFSRTLWLPTMQRYTYYASLHPAIDAYGFFEENELSKLEKKIENKDTEKKLQEASIKYIIIPYDSEKEIFLSDRKYDEKKHQELLNKIDKIKWLKKVEGFKQLKIYEIPNSKEHFWSLEGNNKIDFQYRNPTKYLVNITNAKKNDKLIFSESYDQKWEAILNNQKIKSMEYNKKYNSFILPKTGNYTLEITYNPQRWVEKGIIISSISIATIFIYLIILKIRKKS
jgi:hypothetical protein